MFSSLRFSRTGGKCGPDDGASLSLQVAAAVGKISSSGKIRLMMGLKITVFQDQENDF